MTSTMTLEAVWNCRDKGIALRDEGLKLLEDVTEVGDAPLEEWYDRVIEWEDDLVVEVCEVDYNLYRRLRPLGYLDLRYEVPENRQKRARDVAAITTIINLIHHRFIGR